MKKHSISKFLQRSLQQEAWKLLAWALLWHIKTCMARDRGSWAGTLELWGSVMVRAVDIHMQTCNLRLMCMFLLLKLPQVTLLCSRSMHWALQGVAHAAHAAKVGWSPPLLANVEAGRTVLDTLRDPACNSSSGISDARAGSPMGKESHCCNLPFAAKCWWSTLGSSHPLKEKIKSQRYGLYSLPKRKWYHYSCTSLMVGTVGICGN